MSDITIFLGTVSTVCAILFGYAAYMRNKQKDCETEGRTSGAVLTEMGYIKSGIDDIKRKQERQEEKQEQQYIEIVGRLTSVESSAKQAHKRLDKIEGQD